MLRGIVSVLCLWLLLCVRAYAAQPELDAISRSLQERASDFYAFVQQRHVKILSRPVVSSGILSFSDQQGMCWAIQKPYASRMLIGDKGIFEIKDTGSKQLLMPSANPVFETFSRVYLALFRGEIDALKRDFALTPTIADDGWELHLEPAEDNSLSWLSHIGFSRHGDLVVLKLIEKNEDSTEIEFTPLKPITDESVVCW